ncbi:hypothetical protein LCGC14_0110830 [marine sediment metagenome]|jgi:hypothetical protein|uniref:Antitoxin Xre/MbcA/ParS-like toxin-binding domain-containing protein n=2 Tax=root TaxID=1 RepID=A0A7V1BIU5_9RHOB|nr:hypothetical protein [Sulfitobacter litoralis]HDZ53743.1 hypothetical protein [Sulfitobacter litoralis]
MTSGEKQAILRAIPKLFARWQMTEQQSSDLLGVSREIWNRIQAGHYEEPLTEDQASRALALIGIHVALRVIFTKPRCYNWIMRNNRAPLFAGQSAMDVMIAGGLPAIIRVRQYLEAELAG